MLSAEKTPKLKLYTDKPPMIVLSGATAVGKTKLSIALARAVNGEIISADSMQVYKHMDIGSAKITPEEMSGIPHHMIDVLDPREEFSAAIFKEMCEQCLPGIYERGHIPIVTGGTGFYIQALLRDINFSGDTEFAQQEIKDTEVSLQTAQDTETLLQTTQDTENSPQTTQDTEIPPQTTQNTHIRTTLEQIAEEKGADYLHQLLQQADPQSAELIHANNKKRVIRALEYFYLTGEPISSHNKKEREKPSAYCSCYFVLNDIRERIYERIDKRVDQMLQAGLVAEVESLRQMGCHRGMTSMQGLGYKEILAYLDGEISLEDAAERIKRDTRHFAKRQLTWFRREKDVIWVNKNEFDYNEEKILQYMLEHIRERMQ